MKLLVINGSPKGEKSNSLKLTRAFLDGIYSVLPSEEEIIDLYKTDIRACRGCFACWNKTPGKCVIKDGMAELIEKILKADVVIYSFPLYYFSVPSQLKMFIDRQLPTSLPFMESASQTGGHPSRYDMSGKRFVMISTCGFYTAEGNYDAVNAQFDRTYGKDGYTTIYCGQGELFRVPQLKNRTEEYLEVVRRAGAEFVSGEVSPETQEDLKQLLLPREVFEEMADASWGVEKTSSKGEKTEPALSFTRQMSALYNPSSWNGKDRVLEFYYTDVDKRYQIVMGEKGHKVLTDNFLKADTTIETPLEIWMQIGSGEISGTEAMMKHLYRVTGDFDTMLNWDKYFSVGISSKKEKSKSDSRKTNMSLMLIPWIAIWVALSINNLWGGVIGIAISAIIPFAFLKWKPTIFEYISIFAVTAISLLSMLGVPILYLIPVSYGIFGIMWTVTAFMKIPLSAYYSMNNYGREEALKNPLFMQTNRILTACWGVLYLVTPIWTYFLMKTDIGNYTGAINSILPLLMGIFTSWFQKWYPKYYAQK